MSNSNSVIFPKRTMSPFVVFQTVLLCICISTHAQYEQNFPIVVWLCCFVIIASSVCYRSFCLKIYSFKMSDFDLEGLVNVCETGRSRKRKRDSDKWDKNLRKFARNSASSHGKPSINCKHSLSKLCDAKNLTEEDIIYFQNKIFNYKTSAEQNNFLLKYILSNEPKYRRPRNNNKTRVRLFTTQYFIRKVNGQIVHVCSKTFLSVTKITRRRINSLVKYFCEKGESRPERRGGSRIKPKDVEIVDSVVEFIKSIKCRESHYGRMKSTRFYLDPSLSVKLLWKTWKAKREGDSKSVSCYSKFFKIFQSRFNIGFGQPQTDKCSFCEDCRNQIKASKSPGEKAEFMAKHTLHKRRAKKFYELLKLESDDSITVAFDMQQNQPLPMVRVSEAFYARQIWLYNLTFIIHEKKQNINNTFIYTWTEDQSGRGSNEVASALFNFLTSLEEKMLLNEMPLKQKLRLFSDSTSSQNKNFTVMGFLLNFINNSRVFHSIEHYFPIRGHSFLPPDRVFGRIEKIYRSRQQIVEPQEYHSVLSDHATLKILGTDWRVLNFKKCADIALKTKRPFSMREQRVFIYKKGSNYVSAKNTYTGDTSDYSVVKNVKQWKNVYKVVNIVEEDNKISTAKKKDVQKLLKFVSLTDEAQKFYNKALANYSETAPENHEVVWDEEEPFI